MISDQEIVGCLSLVLALTYVGYRIDMERISVNNRSVPSKRKTRSEAPLERSWWKKPWRCKLGMHAVRRVHAFIGMDPTAAECPACGKIVPWSGTDDGWLWMSYGKPHEHRVWLGGLNTQGPPELRDLRDVYWTEDPIESRVIRRPDLYAHPLEYENCESDIDIVLATTGDCAICADPLHGAERVCERCFHERAGT